MKGSWETYDPRSKSQIDPFVIFIQVSRLGPHPLGDSRVWLSLSFIIPRIVKSDTLGIKAYCLYYRGVRIKSEEIYAFFFTMTTGSVFILCLLRLRLE